ncbi:thioredoxin family protein [Flavobacterium sp. JAS]|uniref:thioredoxin family protein n=1 Tax=Flavobacterium sp. JAS TaxID=2897329 RepID=UPI001E5D29D2|nr:thioredoxin family protein [Flavobacterium sp. JAS]MCD0468226.1 thioredoxin family protein [Flavobacterium sp. JAS]
MTQKLLILLFFLSPLLMKSQSLVWKTSISDAITLSNEEKKPMLILFTTNYASNDLQSEVFETPDFERWSVKNVILVKIDLSDPSVSADMREQNVLLKNAFGVEDLPEVCFANASIRKGKTFFDSLGKVHYTSGGAKKWISDSNYILNP